MRSGKWVLLAILAVTGLAGPASADYLLGLAANYAVLAGSTATMSGLTVVDGDLGVAPGVAITGVPPAIVNGTIHAGDAEALLAQADLTVAYNTLAAMVSTQLMTGVDLGGLTLTAGVYTFTTSAQLTGTLTLDALDDPNALFVFQIGTSFDTSTSSAIVAVNGVDACNVYWQVGSSATLGINSTFTGNIIALQGVTLNSGAVIESGRALARVGAVTMDTNLITAPVGCVDPLPTEATSWSRIKALFI